MNQDIIRRRWPELYQFLFKSEHIPSAAVSLSPTPDPALIVNGIFLESGYDKNREAALQEQLIGSGSKNAWIYGLGTGILAQRLLRRKTLARLDIVILNVALAVHVLQHIPMPWLADRRVHLCYGNTIEKLRGPFAALPGCLRLADDPCSRLRDLIQQALATPYGHQQHDRAFASGLGQRIEKHVALFQEDADVADLFGQKKGQTAVVVAAGPSLTAQLPLLAVLRPDAFFIAVDAALMTLLHGALVPDFTVTIDPKSTVEKFFAVPQGQLEERGLVYFPTVTEQVLRSWPGKRYMAYSRQKMFQAARKRLPRGLLFASGSVIHPAVDLAVRMGADKIILAGADFSFPGGTTHTAGCAVEQVFSRDFKAHTVVNGHGHPVPTTPNLCGYLRDLEDYIAHKPQVQFCNIAKAGALIQGCRYLHLDGDRAVAQPATA